MKKLLAALLFPTALLFAGDGSGGLKMEILKKIVSGIENGEKMKVWSDDPRIMTAFREPKLLDVVDGCMEADIVILEKKENLPKECLSRNIFVLSYKLLIDIPESFGAFFWKKGRPNIVFIESRVRENTLELSEELMPYMEERVW